MTFLEAIIMLGLFGVVVGLFAIAAGLTDVANAIKGRKP